MLEYYNGSVCEDEKGTLSSGETQFLEAAMKQWGKLYEADKKDFQKWTYEQVVEENPKPFLDAIGEIKAIPAYQYVINYLLLITDLNDRVKDQKDFVDFVIEGKFAEGDYKELWQIFTAKLDVLFQQNGYKEAIDWEEFFIKLLKSFSYEILKKLALGVHMSLEVFNAFLTNVLLRSKINFYNRDEILVYLVLQYADEFGCWAYYQAYERLCKLYPEKEDIKKPEWAEQENDVSTISLQKDLQKVLSDIKGSLFEKKNEKLENYLNYVMWQNKRLKEKKIMRTAKKRFLSLWNKLRDRCDETGKLAEFISGEKEEQGQNQVVDGLFWKELTVRYNPETGCVLPASMKFEAKTTKESIEGNNIAVFRLSEEYILPAVKTESVEVKVKALMSETEYKKQEESVLKKLDLKQFIPSDFFENLEKENCSIREKDEKTGKKNPEIVFSKMKVCSEELEKEIEKIQISDKNKPRYYEDRKKGNEGILQVECKIGTFIPKGTQFAFELEGVRFLYESVEDANTSTFDLEVRPLQEWGGKWKQAGMKKTDYIEKKEQLQVSDEGKQSVEGICNAYIGKSEMLGFFDESKKKNHITLSCQKTCHIPRGTIFKYHYKGERFLFESLVDVDKTPYMEANVNAIWDNSEEFKKKVADKKITFLPANTRFVCNLENVYEVFAKKSTGLKPAVLQEGKRKDYQASDRAMFRYIYQMSEDHAAKMEYYQGFPEYGDDYFLNSQMFKNTKIISSHLTTPLSDEERLRNLILTLKFLEYVWWDEEFFDYDADGMDFVMDCFLKDNGTDEELMACGFHTFSEKFPYDRFLALLLNSDDPFALFQAVWSDKLLLRRGKEN